MCACMHARMHACIHTFTNIHTLRLPDIACPDITHRDIIHPDITHRDIIHPDITLPTVTLSTRTLSTQTLPTRTLSTQTLTTRTSSTGHKPPGHYQPVPINNNLTLNNANECGFIRNRLIFISYDFVAQSVVRDGQIHAKFVHLLPSQ